MIYWKGMKLFLTSSCISENLEKTFLDFYGKDPKTSKCYFIPTASDPDHEKFYTCKSMDDLARIGFNPIWYTLKYKNKDLIQKELSDADIIWVGGGNTFYLLEMTQKTGFFEVIHDLVKNKGIAYGGVSAGTLLVAHSIESAGWGFDADSNDVGIQDLEAFQWTSFTPFVHYHKASHERVIRENKKPNEKVLAISDGAMVVVHDDKVVWVGDVEEYDGL